MDQVHQMILDNGNGGGVEVLLTVVEFLEIGGLYLKEVVQVHIRLLAHPSAVGKLENRQTVVRHRPVVLDRQVLQAHQVVRGV